MATELLLSAEPRRALLMGNEAIARGALEAGVRVATTYPGTPASEIGDTLARIGGRAHVAFEYSVNEKVALEVAAGAAWAGLRALTSMKHLGLNVAADPLVTLGYTGVRGGMVIVTACDPSCHTSPNEQDHRLLARLAKLPMLEPSTPDEAREMTRLAFGLSEELELPVLIKTTTRIGHTRGVVNMASLPKYAPHVELPTDPHRFVPMPANARQLRLKLEHKLPGLEEISAAEPWARVTGSGPLGIITAGGARGVCLDAIDELDVRDRVTVLEVGMTQPPPKRRIRELVGELDSFVVVEELEPLLEEEVKIAAAEAGRSVTVLGKASGHLPVCFEYEPHAVKRALARALDIPFDEPVPAKAEGAPALPARPPVLCSGCPHRSAFAALRLATKGEAIHLNDIGCYTLGFGPPLWSADYLLCMGAGITLAAGVEHSTDKPLVAFIGDSTFFHSGITGLVNAVFNQHRLLLVVLDNRTTGMTGHQPSPGAGQRKGDVEVPGIAIEEVARGCGAEFVEVIDPNDIQAALEVFERALERRGLSVVVSRSPCPVMEARRYPGKATPRRYAVDPALCGTCAARAAGIECPARPDPGRDLARAEARVRWGGVEPTGEAAPSVAPCTEACPAGLCIPGYISLVRAGRIAEAVEIIRSELPLAGVCARVCPRPCEAACVRAGLDDPLAICDLKRFALDRAAAEEAAAPKPKPPAPSGKRVAIIGSGPAGLTAAQDLARRGHAVTVYEAAPELGGMLRLGIPAYRLPRRVLDAEIARIADLGVKLVTGTAVGIDLPLSQILADSDAVFVGVGAMRGLKPGIEGEDGPGFADALAYLREVNLGGTPERAERVVVLGGGDAAMDAARTALRLGAREVTVLYRRRREEMPADPRAIAEAEAEGVILHPQVAPLRAIRAGGRLTGIECQRTEPGPPDSSGRCRPIAVAGSEHTYDAHLVIAAIGQAVDADPLVGPGGLALDERGRIAARPDTGGTGDPRIFAGGDAVTGPATVIDAIAAGRRAAATIDRFLGGHVTATGATAHLRAAPLATRGEPAKEARTALPVLAPAERAQSLTAEVATALEPADAAAEAARCLQCAPCAACNACITILGCPALIVEAGRVHIDDALCIGCGVCAQICPNGAIREVPEEVA